MSADPARPSLQIASADPAANGQPPAAESRRESRKRELRTRIAEASMALFAERGFEETTIEEICQRADVARRTLYSYYPTKHDIVRSLCESLVISETTNNIALAIEHSGELAPRLRFMFERMAANVAEPAPLQKILIHQLVADQNASDANNVVMVSELRDAFTALFATASDVQGLGAGMSSALSAEILISVVSALSVNWINDEHYPFAENLQAVEGYLLAGLAR